mmetsp:Transcript_84286/g.158635  ORF Transcript_84286/g.158635 Transcript_84286/m.158635 type:complete len:240 (+) Transcript_84286:1145-1864(+)
MISASEALLLFADDAREPAGGDCDDSGVAGSAGSDFDSCATGGSAGNDLDSSGAGASAGRDFGSSGALGGLTPSSAPSRVPSMAALCSADNANDLGVLGVSTALLNAASIAASSTSFASSLRASSLGASSFGTTSSTSLASIEASSRESSGSTCSTSSASSTSFASFGASSSSTSSERVGFSLHACSSGFASSWLGMTDRSIAASSAAASCLRCCWNAASREPSFTPAFICALHLSRSS